MSSFGTSRSGPKAAVRPSSTKFSTLRKLPAAAEQSGSPAATPVISPKAGIARRIVSIDGTAAANPDTAGDLRAVQGREDDENLTGERIRRHRYAQLVARLHAQRSLYQSTSVFVETMLREVRQSAQVDTAAEAAAATWGLRLLSKNIGHGALECVLQSLLPAVYCDYSPERLAKVSPAVQLQVRDPEVLRDNPYFTHSMFVDEVTVDKKSASHLQTALEAAMRANDQRRDMACRLIDRHRRQCLEVAFRGWRSQVRQQCLLRVMGNNTAKRRGEETARLRAQAVFSQWKLLVERSRCAYLTERLHDAAFQLENAKNQFQLQCYRADRLVHTAKEVTEERDRVNLINEDLQRQVARLEAEQLRREKEYNEKLTRNVAQLLKLLGSYDTLARVLLHSKQITELSSAERRTSGPPPEDIDALQEMPEDTSESPSPVAAATDAKWETPSDTALQLLRQWCNGVLAHVSGRPLPFAPIRSFGADFANGERYLYILQYVYPEVVTTVLSIHEMDVEARMRRIRGYATDCGLRYAIVPSDLLNEREDLLVCSLSELYARHLHRNWDTIIERSAAELDTFRESGLDPVLQGCSAALTPSTGPESGGAAAVTAPVETLDEDAVRVHIADYAERVKSITEGFSTSLTVENELVKAAGAILAQEARLGCERLQGTPIPVVEAADRRAFWELPSAALEDLRELPQVALEAKIWDLVVSQSLPAVLQEHVDTTSRLFFLYAGENAKTMSEVAFWRFIEYSGVLVGAAEMPADWVARQYDHVVTPQLDSALRAVARNQSEMSVQKLRQVAYQEMDIRNATPVQFVELLVRIAVTMENGERGLVEGTRNLLQTVQSPGREKTSPIARELFTAESQHVLRFFYEDLFRVFLFYVKQQETTGNMQDNAMATQNGGRFAAHMSVTTLLALLDDCRFLSDSSGRGSAPVTSSVDATRPRYFISATHTRKLVASLGRLCPGIISGGLSFNLLVEMLAMIAHHWCPDPLVPEPRRLASFLAYTVQQLSTRHANSSLLLGTVPSISLEGTGNVDFSYEARPNAHGPTS